MNSQNSMELKDRHCKEQKKGTPALDANEISELIGSLHGWVADADSALHKTFKFENYYQTMAFVNAVAIIAHGQNHHPDLEVGYNQAKITYSTHSVGGLSDNDFISAAKVEALLRLAGPQPKAKG